MESWRKLPVHTAAGEERGNTRLPSQQRVCFPPDAMHGESGLFVLRCPWGEDTPPTSYVIWKRGKRISFFFFPLYILRMTNGPLGPPGSMEGRSSGSGEWRWKCSAMAEGGQTCWVLERFVSASEHRDDSDFLKCDRQINASEHDKKQPWLIVEAFCRWPALERLSQINQIKWKK